LLLSANIDAGEEEIEKEKLENSQKDLVDESD
jgi:hypothetical protein